MVTLVDQGIMYVVINFKEKVLFWAGLAWSSFSTRVTMTLQINGLFTRTVILSVGCDSRIRHCTKIVIPIFG
jgi:hypothetical protein